MKPRNNAKSLSQRGTQYPNGSTVRVIKMPGQMRDWQIKCVCGGTDLTCNGGWMRRIENLVKPIITPLILGTQTRITIQQQSHIATWAVLKSMVSEYDDGNRPVTHHMQRRYLMNRLTPPQKGWGVWIGNYERKAWIAEWVSRPFLVLPTQLAIKRASMEATYFNSNSTTQVIGNLFIQVVHSPMPGFIDRWRFTAPEGGTVIRIWPPAAFSIVWPSSTLSDRDADNIANAVPEFVLSITRKRQSS